MTTYRTMASRQRKWMLILLAIVGIVTLVVPSKQYFFLGLLLGVVIGYYNLFLLQRKTNAAADAAEAEGKRKGVGTVSRLAAAALGTIIAIRYDLSIVGLIIGLMAVYPVIMIDFIWFNRNVK